jgi:hypothetical protein
MEGDLEPVVHCHHATPRPTDPQVNFGDRYDASVSRAAGLVGTFKLIESAQTRWRAVNAPQLATLVRAGVKFEKGVMVGRSEEHETEVAA